MLNTLCIVDCTCITQAVLYCTTSMYFYPEHKMGFFITVQYFTSAEAVTGICCQLSSLWWGDKQYYKAGGRIKGGGQVIVYLRNSV